MFTMIVDRIMNIYQLSVLFLGLVVNIFFFNILWGFNDKEQLRSTDIYYFQRNIFLFLCECITLLRWIGRGFRIY